MAARNGLTVVVQELLAKGASVLAVDENGNLFSFSGCGYMYSLESHGSLKSEDDKIRKASFISG